MFDGSTLPLDENLRIASGLLARCSELDVILEVESGVVGGEEDGIVGPANGRDELYTTPSDLLRVADALGIGERGRYLVAATFGNVHGTYAPGNVVLRPEILQAGQQALAAVYPDARFQYVFHGSSGSSERELADAVSFGVVKVNVDTDNQYAFTRGSPATCWTIGRVCSKSTAGSGTSAVSTRGAGAAPARRRWPSASGKPASSSDRPDAASRPRSTIEPSRHRSISTDRIDAGSRWARLAKACFVGWSQARPSESGALDRQPALIATDYHRFAQGCCQTGKGAASLGEQALNLRNVRSELGGPAPDCLRTNTERHSHVPHRI